MTTRQPSEAGSSSRLDRRGFLKLASALLATGSAASLATACGPTATPSPAKPAADAKPTEASKPAAPAATAPPAVQAAPATAAPKPAEAAKPAARTPAGEIKVLLPTKITTLDPHGAQSVDTITFTATRHVMETLVIREPNGTFVPNLAASWENPEPTTWVFKLRPDARFHDGSKVTSADVKASLERVISLKGPQAPLWAAVDAVETPDETTVLIKTKTPSGTLLASSTLLLIAPARASTEGFFSKPIGSGPFKVVSFTQDADFRVEANTDHWSGPPGLKNMTFRYVPEVAARVTALETGEVDFTWQLPPDQLPALRRNPDLRIDEAPSFSYYFIWMNASRPPFTDKRVRQAMAHALDVDTIVKDLLAGVGKRATAPIPESVFGYAPQTPYAYDPDRAKQLLAEAGQQNGFETSMIWNPNSGPQDRELVQALLSYWNAIGVRVRSLELERAQWLDNLIKLEWDMDFQTNSVTTGDADFTLNRLYHSRANRNGYKNPELDRLLDEAAASTDQRRRAELYAQANKLIWEEAPGIFPFDLLGSYVYRKHLAGFVPPPSQTPSFNDVTLQR